MSNEQQTSRFNPREHLITLKNRQGSSEYLPVQWRLVWFRLECPNGTIETEIIHLDPDKETEEETYAWNNETRRSEKVIKTARGLAIVRATIRDGKGGVATGTKMEKAASFGDWLEKSETGAIGRALAALGYGTQFTDNEFEEGQRIADAPVDRGTSNARTDNNHAQSNNKPTAASKPNQPAARPAVAPPESRQEQERGITQMCNKLKMEVPDLSKLADGDVTKKWVDLYPIWRQAKDKEKQEKSA